MTALVEATGVPPETAAARCRVAYLAWLGRYTDAAVTSRDALRADMGMLWRMVMGE